MKITLSKNKKYVLGVSYGPDSMALLHMFLQKKYNFVVCYVNYHLREESNFEEKELIKYLKENGVKRYVLEAHYNTKDKNVEEWARKIRYERFKEICIKENTNNIVIAHNQDDLIETYLIQKKRNSIVSRYGLIKKYMENQYVFYRPLLDYSKQELLEYCINNHVPNAIDKSNFDIKYLRNDIRINIVSKLSKEERYIYISKIENENQSLIEIKKKIKKLCSKVVLHRIDILNLSIEEFNHLIINKLKRLNISYSFSKKFVMDVYEKIKNNKSFIFKNNFIAIYYSYNNFLISQSTEQKYCYTLETIACSIFKLNKDSKYMKLIEKDKDYIVKNIEKDDVFEINGLKKRVNRLFIDQHTPTYLRNIWPGIYDESNKLVYTPHFHEKNIRKKQSIIDFNVNELIKCFLLYKIK